MFLFLSFIIDQFFNSYSVKVNKTQVAECQLSLIYQSKMSEFC